jgi:hypothetical protein
MKRCLLPAKDERGRARHAHVLHFMGLRGKECYFGAWWLTFKKLRFQPMISTPEEFGKLMATQADRWPPIIKAAGQFAD